MFEADFLIFGFLNILYSSRVTRGVCSRRVQELVGTLYALAAVTCNTMKLSLEIQELQIDWIEVKKKDSETHEK